MAVLIYMERDENKCMGGRLQTQLNVWIDHLNTELGQIQR